MKYNKGFAGMILIGLVIAIIAVGGYFVFVKKSPQLSNEPVSDSLVNLSINNPFSKDANYVYYRDKIIPNADPKTFQYIAGIYLKDKQHIFAYSCLNEMEGNYSCINMLDRSDSATFVVLNNGYAKDSKEVYYGEKVVKDADPSTFVVIDEPFDRFARDSSHVFFYGNLIKDADPYTFIAITESSYYAKDKSHVWMFGGTPVLLPVADPTTFKVLDGLYAKDNSNVYRGSEIVKNADPRTFSTIVGSGLDYRKDYKAVYYGDTLIPGADPDTFKNLHGSRFSIDKNYAYYTSPVPNVSIIPGADVASFTTLSEFGNEFYSKDKNFVYFETGKVPEADPSTFISEWSQGNWHYDAHDKNHFYVSGKITTPPTQ